MPSCEDSDHSYEALNRAQPIFLEESRPVYPGTFSTWLHAPPNVFLKPTVKGHLTWFSQYPPWLRCQVVFFTVGMSGDSRSIHAY